MLDPVIVYTERGVTTTSRVRSRVSGADFSLVLNYVSVLDPAAWLVRRPPSATMLVS